MPDSWNAAEYRRRAQAWQLRAETFPEGKERDLCQALADGYTQLALLLERNEQKPLPSTG